MTRPQARSIAWFAIFILLALLGAVAIRTDVILVFDRYIALIGRPDAPLREVMEDLTSLGSATLITVFALVAGSLLIGAKRSPQVVQLAVATVGSAAWVSVLKTLYDRDRPDAGAALTHFAHSSFPSGHSFGAAVLFCTLAYIVAGSAPHSLALRRWAWTTAIALTVLVALSRVYLRVHHASDVVAGLAMGFAWAAFVAALCDQGVFGRTIRSRDQTR